MPFSTFQAFFWLFCGLWAGIGGAVFTWFRMRKHVANGEFSEQEVKAFATGMALWIFVPGLLFWGMQASIAGDAPLDFTVWPTPQKYFALTLLVFLWSALIFWTFLRDGAATLSRFRSATSNSPAFMNSPTAMKIGVVAAVACGIFSLFFFKS